MRPRPRNYWVGLAVATDQWFNALFGGNPDETMSSSIHASALSGTRSGVVAERIVDALAYAVTGILTLGRAPQSEHCSKSYERLLVRTEDQVALQPVLSEED